jgi:hypothetical protein
MDETLSGEPGRPNVESSGKNEPGGPNNSTLDAWETATAFVSL